jgi:hypothetical protein
MLQDFVDMYIGSPFSVEDRVADSSMLFEETVKTRSSPFGGPSKSAIETYLGNIRVQNRGYKPHFRRSQRKPRCHLHRQHKNPIRIWRSRRALHDHFPEANIGLTNVHIHIPVLMVHHGSDLMQE